MKFSVAAATLALATAVTAAKVPQPSGPQAIDGCRPKKCITQEQADQFIERFTHVITHTDSDLGDYLTTLDILLAEEFQEISGSINSLAGFDPEAITAPSKAAYVNAVTHAPAAAGVNTIFTVAACRNIVWHWDFRGIGTSKYPIRGFSFFKFDAQCKTTELQLEFNSIAWGLNTGYGLVWPNGTVQN